MPHYAALLIEAPKRAKLVDAVRAAYLATGATEGGDHDVLIGEVVDGWVIVTDSTHHTIDLGVAERLARALGTRVLAAGFRGSGSHGKAAARAYGTWGKTKIPTASKAKALRDIVVKLGDGLVLEPHQVVARPGTRLTFSLAKATRTPGPFKTNTVAELRAEAASMRDEAIHDAMNDHLNGHTDDAMAALGALRNTHDWQIAYDAFGDSMFTSPSELTPDSARLLLHVGARAFVDGTTWTNKRVGSYWVKRRLPCALAASAVAGDTARFAALLGQLPKAARPETGKELWSRFGATFAEFLTPAMHATLTAAFPDPEARAIARAPLPAAKPKRARGTSTYLERQLASDEDHELELATALCYVGDDLLVGVDERVAIFRAGKLHRSAAIGKRGTVMALARLGSKLVASLDAKVLEVAVPSLEPTPLWSVSGECVNDLAVSPSGRRVALVGASHGNPGKICEVGGKRALASFAGLDYVAWLGEERVVGAAWNAEKIALYTIGLDGTETCHGGGLRARLHALATLDGAVYLGTSKGLYRATLGAARPATKAADLEAVWGDAAVHALAVLDATLYAATTRGVLAFTADGGVQQLAGRAADTLAVAPGRIAYGSVEIEKQRLRRSSVYELVR